MIEQIFPTLLYVTEAKNQQLDDIQSEISNKLDNIDIDYKQDWGKTHQLSSLSDDIISRHNMTNLQRFINAELRKYSQDMQYQGTKEYKMESWVSVFNENDYGHQHDHGNADISGVYYYQTSTQDGDIVFHNPSPQVHMSTCFKSNTWKHTPKVGKLLLFPGYLQHSIARNESSTTRISISFNIFFNKY